MIVSLYMVKSLWRPELKEFFFFFFFFFLDGSTVQCGPSPP
jgi:hypothetical protein